MTESAIHLARAWRSIRSGTCLLENEFSEEAGRGAYMAAFHAALAYIVAVTGKEPRTHRGTQVEFARLAHERGQISHEFVMFLSRSYEFKDISDYQGNRLISATEATSALETATRLIAAVEVLFSQDPGP